MVPRIDHVMLLTLDGEETLARLRSLGFGSVLFGSFGDGVCSRTVPCLSGQYLEVLTAEHEGPGADWLRGEVAAGHYLAGWAIEVDDIHKVAARVGRPVSSGLSAEGAQSSWQTIDFESGESFLPFFIRYEWTGRRDDGVKSRLEKWIKSAHHARTPTLIDSLELVGDRMVLDNWLDPAWSLPLRVVDGNPRRLASIRLQTDEGPLDIASEVCET